MQQRARWPRYCGSAAWPPRCLHDPDDPAAERQVAAWALGLLAGNIDQVIEDMDTRAAALPSDRRSGLKTAVGYRPATATTCATTTHWNKAGRSPPA